MTRRASFAISALMAALPALADAWPDDTAIRAELQRYVETEKAAPGVVVGLLDGSERRFLTMGKSGNSERPQIDGDTIFELGSITKTLTGMLLADAVARGEVALDTPVGALLPAETRPDAAVAAITLEELATHHAGLPSIPLEPLLLARMLLSDDPYAAIEPEAIFRSAATVDRGNAAFAYSNFGVALLGQLLARRAGVAYPQLLRERILAPRAPGFHLEHPVGDPRLASGFHKNFRPAPAWHLDGYAPAGALLGSADDLLDLAAALLRPDDSTAASAMRPRRSAGGGDEVGLCFLVTEVGGRPVVWHNGGTGGFRTFFAVLPEERRALAVLTNGLGDPEPLGWWLIDPSGPRLPAREPPWLPGQLAWVVALLVLPAAPWLGLWRMRRTGFDGVDRADVLFQLALPAMLFPLLAALGPWDLLPYFCWQLAVSVALPPLAALAWMLRLLPWNRGKSRKMWWLLIGGAIFNGLVGLVLL